MMTRNIGVKKLCQRNDCMVCIFPGAKGNCRSESITYQISCTRSPCVENEFNPTKPFKFDDSDRPGPSLYRGESSRTPYIRSQTHLKDYRSHKESSPLWRHTKNFHQGEIGQDKGILHYQMVQLEEWPKPLDRLSAEGVLIEELENLQHNNKAKCINSKKDFKQCHTVTMTFSSGSNND